MRNCQSCESSERRIDCDFIPRTHGFKENATGICRGKSHPVVTLSCPGSSRSTLIAPEMFIMKDIFERFLGQEIGMNIESPYHIDSFTIESVADYYFTVSRKKNSNLFHIPYQNIIRIVEDDMEGIHIGGLFHQKKDYQLVVKIGHYVTSVPD
jgi:hypothetical protein